MIATSKVPELFLSQDIADHSRVWIYQNDQTINPDNIIEIDKVLQDFARKWAAHGSPLNAKVNIYFDRFICLFVDERNAGASGCSIDSSVHLLQNLEKKYGLNLFDRMNAAYFDRHGEIQSAPVSQFAELQKAGLIDAETLVFNNTVQTMAQLRQGWIIPIRESWHARWIAA